MSNLCNETPNLLNTAEIVEIQSRGSLTLSQWSKSTSTYVLISHPAVVSEIYKKNSRQKNTLKFHSFFRVSGSYKELI